MPYASYTNLKSMLEEVIGQMLAEPSPLKRLRISKDFRHQLDAFIDTHFSTAGNPNFGLRDYHKKRWQPGSDNHYASFTVELDELIRLQYANASLWVDKFVAASIACRPTYSGKVFKAAASGDFNYLTHNDGGQSAASISEAGDLVGFPTKDDAAKGIVHAKFVSTRDNTGQGVLRDHLNQVIETLELEITVTV